MKKFINEILVICGLSMIVVSTWQHLELEMMGEIVHREVDDVISAILILSLYINFKNYK